MRRWSFRGWWRTTFGLVSIVGMVFALTTLAIGIIAFEATHEALEEQLDHRIVTEADALIAEGDEGTQGIAKAIGRRELAKDTASLEFRLVDSAGRVLAGSLDAVVPEQPGYVELLPYTRNGEQRIAQSLTTILPQGHRLLVAADRTVIDAMDATLLKLFIGAFGVMLVLGIGAAWIVGAVTRRRLSSIDQTAQAIIGGNLHERMPVTGDGNEFDRVADTLNQMLDRITILMDSLRQVSSDVAHDLRTPLTRLHNCLHEAMTSDDREAQRRAIETATAQSRELLDIFAALLRIAEVEGMGTRGQFKQIDLSALVEEIAETYRPDMENSGLMLATAIEADIAMTGDRRLIQQLLTNLLDNAVVHTPPGTHVQMSLERENGGTCLTVADDGPGAPTDGDTDLFQRFTRGERSRSTCGHGLGLALVAAIVASHGGKCHLVTQPGFRLTIDLP